MSQDIKGGCLYSLLKEFEIPVEDHGTMVQEVAGLAGTSRMPIVVDIIYVELMEIEVPIVDLVLNYNTIILDSMETYEPKSIPVKNIPQSFESVRQYFGSYVYPLLEETHAQVCSSMEIISTAPFAEVIAFYESEPYGENLYKVQVDYWSNRYSDCSKEPYKTLPGDILILADAKPEHISDLQRIGRSWAVVMVTKIREDDIDDNEDIREDNDTSTSFKVKALKDIDVDVGKKSWFVVFLTNTTPNKRMWNALHMHENLNIIRKVLRTSSLNEEDCDLCFAQSDGSWDEKLVTSITSKLNESQNNAILDAKKRQCFFEADEDNDLAKAILDVKKEFEQFDDLLNPDSILFKSARWKVLFSDNFLKSFQKLKYVRTKKLVINLLLKISSGWRPKKLSVVCESSSQILKKFKVEGLYIVCANDIVKEWSNIAKELRDLEISKSWSISFDIVRIKNLDNHENGSDLSRCAADGRSYVENARVSESLMLMKFYFLSSSVVTHLLSNNDGGELDLPFEVSDQELEIILYPRSAFVLGRSGTGKTTVLTMKLFQKEKLHHKARELLYEEKEVEVTTAGMKENVLHQLFVTVSLKLCYAVKQHVSHLKSFSCGGNSSKGSSSIDMDDFDNASQFKDIPDSFVDVPPLSYPLVITFHKFLIMLDGTVGNSYFERFHEARKLLNGPISGSSVSLQSFIRMKEVNYERFSTAYWPRFNTQLTKKLDSSRVFTEIISHIKGGPQAAEAGDGKLSREDYVLLSEGRVSRLCRREREIIYEIFQNYEKMKKKNGEFDFSDLVIDLHRRLRVERYKGDEMHFVYVDEVQDLTLSQIALFKYICKNVEEGFVFSGDTAQTISKGIDFRFEDIRSLFYNKFVLESKSSGQDRRKEKGIISEIFHLSQNFRTHDGVLKLSQSVIELIYHFFPLSTDVLQLETSLIYGEAPILLESGNKENAIITIFGNSGNGRGSIVGFGAEQVILVRDDFARKEITNHVGNQALVLTIVECKGLEFQDVLLYNFFGSSSLKNEWRVIYKYMEEQDLLDPNLPISFPSFNEAKHNVLCFELKQLYVAITRTRQRLWIFENSEDLCKPMFDYWKKKCLVQVRQLDDSLAQAMQVSSSPEEWKSRGIKLYYEHNFLSATKCFERAGDIYWQRRSKAAGLRKNADHMRGSNPETANVMLRQAAELFETIGKADSAAQCFSDLGEYGRAGRLYLEKCGESKLQRAGECFCLAGCYELAAEVYAKGNFFSECLKVCVKRKLFNMGFKYIQYWKNNATKDFGVARRGKEIDKIEHKFLEIAARHHHKLKDSRSMMQFVKAFQSIDLMRAFLKSLDCLGELLLLEEESGNFLEAANIAKLRGEILHEADLLGKAGNVKEASMLLLYYVLYNSLWTPGSKGWPLKQFTQKQELLAKAKSFAKNDSNFYSFICTEADILSNEQSDLSMTKEYLNASQRHNSVGGEIISARKILDAHLQSNSAKNVWHDYFVFDLTKHSEQVISRNQISVETLFYFWNFWRDKILSIFKYLRCPDTQDVNEYRRYGDFCLNYLGVRRQFHNLNAIYVLLNSDADWVREESRFIHRNGNLVYIDVRHFVATAQSYWCSELLCVGMKVLDNLEALYNFSLKNSLSLFCQSRSLTYIYEVAKFLLESEYRNHSYCNKKTLQRFVELTTNSFFGYIFPLDWRKSLAENMFSLRESKFSRNLLEQVIIENISLKGKLTYGQIGRVAVITLGLGKINNGLYKEILKRFDGTYGNPPWKKFIQVLFGYMGPEFPQGTLFYNNFESPRELCVLLKLQEALMDTYNANWREVDYISPGCFLYLIDRLLILASYFQGYFITSKSSFAEWFIYQDADTNPNSTLVAQMRPSHVIFEFIVNVVQQLLCDKNNTMDWIRRSNINVKDYYPLLVLRLVSIICLVHLNSGEFLEILFALLGRSYITEQLPWEFYDVLQRRRKHINVNVLAEAFKKIHNPLVIVSLGGKCSSFLCPDAIFVDLTVKQCRADMLKVLFPETVKPSQGQTETFEVEATNSGNGVLSSGTGDQDSRNCKSAPSNFALVADQGDLNNINGSRVRVNNFCEIFEALKSLEHGKDPRSFLLNVQIMKVNVEKSIHLVSTVMHERLQNAINNVDENLLDEVDCMVDELKQLSAALNVSEPELGYNMSTIQELCKRLLSRRPNLEPILSKQFLQLGTNLVVETSGSISNEQQCDVKDSDSKAKENSSADVASVSNSKNSRETENKVKGNKSRKNKRGKKGGSKR
nr:tpr and ankyrin repeat-containing protein 1 [Quercus suber]